MFEKLKDIIDGRDLQDNGCEQWCSPSEYQNSAVSKNEDFRIAIKSKSFAKLSQKTRQELNNVPKEVDTGFIEIFDSMNDGTIEIVEINDPKNPAKLFSIPGDKVYGVRTKQAFRQGQPVCAYGGLIEQHGANEEWSSYKYDVQVSDREGDYEGARVFINGENSIGGKINDPWAPPGLPQRRINIHPDEHWDSRTCTPQIVFTLRETLVRVRSCFTATEKNIGKLRVPT